MGDINQSLANLNNSLAVLSNYQSVENTNENNMNIAKLATEYDYKKWVEQNLYNSPAEQMSRLKAAGLNPNLVYGTGNVTGNQSGAPPQMRTATLQAPQMPVQDYIMAANSAVQMKKASAQTDLIEQQTINEKLNGLFTTEKTTGQTLSNKEKTNLLEYQSKMLEADLQRKAMENQITDFKIRYNLGNESKIILENARKAASEAKSAQIKADYEEKLKEYNMNANDSPLLRGLLWIYQNAFEGKENSWLPY